MTTILTIPNLLCENIRDISRQHGIGKPPLVIENHNGHRAQVVIRPNDTLFTPVSYWMIVYSPAGDVRYGYREFTVTPKGHIGRRDANYISNCITLVRAMFIECSECGIIIHYPDCIRHRLHAGIYCGDCWDSKRHLPKGVDIKIVTE